MLVRDKKHLKKVRMMDCLIDGFWDESVVPHHLTFKECGGGMAMKAGDNFTVPLNHRRHMELHQHGEESFWRLHGHTKEGIINLAQGLYNVETMA